MQIEQRAIGQVRPYKQNARKIPRSSIDKVAKSIEEFGWQQPIVVDKDSVIIVGHTRLLAARKLKQSEVPVLVADLPPAKARAYRLMDNRSHEESEWDTDLLIGELAELKNLGLDMLMTGFDFPEIEKFLSTERDTDAEEALPPVGKVAVSRIGDVWLCGRHRVVCGDSTDSKAAQAATGAALGLPQPNLMVTDPPYGVEYDPGWRNDAVQAGNGKIGAPGGRATGKVYNDNRADWRDAYRLFTGDVAYVWHSALHTDEVIASIEIVGLVRRSIIIWAKQSLQISRGHYHWQYEPCWYAVRKGAQAHWHGDRKQSNLWSIPNVHATQGTKDDGKNEHSTQKPVECMRRPMLNHTKRGDAVYDPFLGSGTTVIAAEQSDRICYGIELNPLYVDLIVRRWQTFAEKEATLEADGRTFTMTESARNKEK